MRKSLLVGTIALMMLSSSCKKDSPVSPPAGGGNEGTPVADAVRQASIDAVEQRFAALTWENYDADKAALVQFLQSRPEFEAAGAGSGASVWARFTDGRLLIIANNRPHADSLEPTIPLDAPTLQTPGSELPVSGNARLMNAMGSWYTNTLPVLRPMLQARGYTVNPVTDASVGNLKSVSGDGAFYINTHGGSGKKRDGSDVYALWTSTEFDTVTDNSLKPDWNAGRLAYFTAKHNAVPNRQDTATLATHFAITEEFVGTYMGFGTNALIYLDACGAYGGDKFRNRCAASSDGGTGIVAGWTFGVGDRQAADVTVFTFGRLLGYNPNPINPENPPQRAFTYQLVYQDLVNRGMDKYTDPKDGSVAFFGFTPATSEFGLLAPSIKFLWVDEIDRKLVVTGTFGKDPRSDGTGTVTVNGNLLTIQSWNNDGEEIICSIPPAGASAAGDVIVTVRGHESNVVRLTEWIGEIRMIMTSGYVGMNLTVTFSLHLRADVHSFRERPHETPRPASLIRTFGAPDTHGDWSLGGGTTTHHTSFGCNVVSTENWANNSGSLPIEYFNGGPPNAVYMNFDIQPRTRRMTVTLDASATNAISWSGVDSITCSGPTIGVPFSSVSSFSTSIFDRTAPGFDTLTLSFAPNFDILPRTTQRPNQMNPFHAGDPNATQTPLGLTIIECAGIQARYPPDPNAGQRPLASTRRRR